jgi:hypothetical protein
MYKELKKSIRSPKKSTDRLACNRQRRNRITSRPNGAKERRGSQGLWEHDVGFKDGFSWLNCMNPI